MIPATGSLGLTFILTVRKQESFQKKTEVSHYMFLLRNMEILFFQKEDYETFTIGLPDIINKTLKVVLTKTNAIEEIRLVPYTSEAYQNYINYFLDTFIGNNRDDVKIKKSKIFKVLLRQKE